MRVLSTDKNVASWIGSPPPPPTYYAPVLQRWGKHSRPGRAGSAPNYMALEFAPIAHTSVARLARGACTTDQIHGTKPFRARGGARSDRVIGADMLTLKRSGTTHELIFTVEGSPSLFVCHIYAYRKGEMHIWRHDFFTPKRERDQGQTLVAVRCLNSRAHSPTPGSRIPYSAHQKSPSSGTTQAKIGPSLVRNNT